MKKFLLVFLLFILTGLFSSNAIQSATLVTVPSNSRYCQGTAGVVMQVQNSVNGTIYRLRKPLAGPGDLATVMGNGGTVTFPGNYQAGTYITVPATNSVTVVMDPQPTNFTVVMSPSNGKFCNYPGAAGVEISIAGSQAGVEYELFKGSISQGLPWTGDGSGHSFGFYNAPGSYSVIATIPETGCQKTMGTVTVISNTPPAAGFSFNITNPCSSTPVQFTNTTPGSPLTFLWRFDDPKSGLKNISTLANPSHVFEAWGNSTQTFNVKLKVTDANGCRDSIIHPVTVTQKPDATLTELLNPANPSYPNTFAYCGANNVNPFGYFEFHNSSTTQITNTNYQIQWGLCTTTPTYNSTTFSANIPVTYECLGEQTITYTVNGQNGCSNTRNYGVFVGSNPGGGLTTPSNTYGVAPFLLNFIIPNQAYSNTPGTEYVYNFGDGVIDTIYQEDLPANQQLPHTYTTCSTVPIDGLYAYKTTCTVKNPCGFISTQVFPIHVSCKAEAGFGGGWGGGSGWFPGDTAVNHLVGCNPVNFSNTTTPGFYIFPNGASYTTNTIYSWNFGDPASGINNTSNLANPIHTFTTPGQVYTVTLIAYTGQNATNNSGYDTIVNQIYIQTDPTADFEYDITDACTPKYVQINDLSDVGGLGVPLYTWSVVPPVGWSIVTPGHENDPTYPEPLFKFTAMGPQPFYQDTIKLTLENSCGVSVKKLPVLICEPPEAAFQFNDVYYCGPGPRLFNPSYDLNCDSATINILWEITPSAGITFDQGTSANSYKPVINFPAYGDYQVKVTITNDCGTDFATQNVHITQSITGNTLTASPSQGCGCLMPVTISGSVPSGGSGTYTYEWEMNSGSGWQPITVGGTQNYIINEPLCQSTMFRRTVYDAGDCVDESLPVEVTVYPGVQNNLILSNQQVCSNKLPETIQGTLPVGGNQPFTYLWESSIDNGSTWTSISGATGKDYSPPILSQTTQFRRIVNSDPCQPNASVPVNISVCEPIGANTISAASAEVCAGKAPAPFTGTDPSGACGSLIFTWQKSDVPPFTTFVTISGATGPTYQSTPLNSLTHFRRVVTSQASCDSSFSNSIIITVNPNPVAEAGVYAPVTNGWPVTLTGTASGGTPGYPQHHWSPEANINGDPNQATVTTYGMTATTPFTYTVTDSKGCTDDDIAIITVTGNQLSCNITGNPASVCPGCPNGNVQICVNPSGGSGNYTYSWTSTPPGFLSSQQCINVCPSSTTVYSCLVWDGFVSCSVDFTVTVDPVPAVTSLLTATICSGTALNYTPTAQVPGTTFSWTTTAGSCTGNNSGQGTTISDVLFNNGNEPCTVQYQITPMGPLPTNCLGAASTLVVEVLPVAQVTNATNSQVVVSGQLSATVNIETNVTGASVRWEFFDVTCPGFIGPYLPNGTGPVIPAQLLTLLPGSPAVCSLRYKITPYVVLPGGAECPGNSFIYTYMINTEPQKYDLICPAPVCQGSSVSIKLNGSDIGIEYQLMKENMPVVGSTLPGTGDTLSWDVLQSGVYTVKGTNVSNQQSVLMNGQCQAVINPNPGAGYLIGSTGNCVGDHITLNGSQTGVRYELYNNGINTLIFRDGPGPLDFGPQSLPGVYTIKATFIASGCTVWIDGSITLLPLPQEFVFVPFGSLCAGDEFSINGSQPGILYSLICTPTVGASFTLGPWMGDGNPVNFGPQPEPGIYKVLAYNPLTGCDILMADEKLIWPNPIPFNVTPATPQCGTTTIGIDNSETGFTYRVHKIDPISGNPYNLPDPAFPAQTGISGQPLIFGSTSVPWTYCVIAFDPNNICNSEMNGRVTVLPTPTQYNIQPTGTLCFNPSVGIEIFLEHSELGVNYTLFMDGAPWSIPVAGIGGTGPLSFGFIAVPGTFTIVANHASSNCTAVMTGSLTLVPNPAPFIMNPPGDACPGSEIWLSGSQINVNYTLNLPAGQTITKPGDGNPLSWGPMYQPGTYYISAASTGNSCIGNMTGATTIRPNPGVFSLLPPGIHCEPQVLSMQNAEAGTTYEILYSNGSSLNPPVSVTTTTAGGFSFGVPLNAGIYIVRAENSFGCDTLMNGAVTIHARPTVDAGPTDTTICNLPPWSIDLSGTAGNYTNVLWTSPTNPTGSNFSNPGSLQTSYTFTAADLANKTVTLTLKATGTGGCATATSQDQITVHILAPIVDAGTDQSACVSQKFTLSGTVAGNTTTGEWSGGAGTFSPNRQALQAEYTPDPSEAGTSVVLTLSSTQADPCPNVSDQVTLTIHAPLTSGLATGNQTICHNQVPQPLQATVPSGGSGMFSYQWQQLTGTGWTNLPGETALGYAPPALTATTQYRIVQSDQFCSPIQSVNSNILTITVYNILISGVVQNPQSICVGETPSPLSITVPTGGSGQFTYQWQSQSGALGWMNITGATSTVYAPAALMETTRYRVIQNDTYCNPSQEIISSEVMITVYAPLGGGTATQDQVICHGSIPATLNVTLPTGGSGSFAQQWQRKIGTADFEDIPLATGMSYAPPALTTTTQYRVVHTDIGCNSDQQAYSNVITITVHDQFNAGTAGQDQTICFGEVPNPLQITPPSGGSGNFGYQWYKDTGSGWSIITGASSSVFQPASLTLSTQYRVVQTDNNCQPFQNQTSNTVTVTVRQQLISGQLSQAQTICNGERPAALNITQPQGGSSSINLVWQMRTSGNPWITITGANSLSYWPESLNQTTEYRVLQNDPSCNPLQSVESNIVTISVYLPLVAGTLTADQSQCFGEVPLPLTVTLPSGGSTQYALQWQSKSGTGDWINIPGAYATVYNPGALTVSTQFRVLQQDLFCSAPQQVSTNIVTITVHDQLREGTATSDQTICYGNNPNYLTATALQGGTGNYSYQWQSKSGTGNWADITGENNLNYLPPALYTTTQFRLVQTDQGCAVPQSVYTNIVTITVHSEMIPGILTANQTICYGEKPVTLTAGLPAGGSGDFTYQWQSKVGAGGWNNIGGATLITFSPPNLTLTTSYRLLQRDVGCFPMQEKITNEITITVHPRLQAGVVLSDQVICHGETPLALTSAPPVGGSGNYELQWQYQTGGTGWFNIPGANALILSPAALQVTTQYRLVITDLNCAPNQVTNSGTVTITVHGLLISGVASGDQSICYNTVPQPLQAGAPAGGSTQFTYQWQVQTLLGIWNDIPSANGLTFAPPALTQTTRYRLRTTDGYCNPDQHVFSNEVVITVFGVLGSGTATADQTICRGEAPMALNLGSVSGGSGNFSYQWQVQSAGSGWSNIPGATQSVYSPPALFQTTQYRVVQSDNHCTPGQQVASNAVTITVHSALVSGVAGNNQTICFAETPALLNLSLPGGGSGNFSYQWQYLEAVGDWTDIPGANGRSYQPNPLAEMVKYRVIQTDLFCEPNQQLTSNIVTINVYPQLTPGVANSDQTICYGETPDPLIAQPPSGGSGQFNYNWQVLNGFGNWLNINGATTLTYSPPALFTTTKYRISQIDPYCNPDQSVASVTVTITVHPQLVPGSAGPDQVLCFNEQPVPISGTLPTGGSGNTGLQWQSKTGSGNWENIPNATGLTYVPGLLPETTQFRLTQTDEFCDPDQFVNTNPVTLTIVPLPQPTVLGPAQVCVNSSGNIYQTQPGKHDYEWTVTGGIVTAGGGINDYTITVTWNILGTGTISVNYRESINDCKATNPFLYQVDVVAPPVPVIVTSPPGNTVGCLDQCVTFETEAGMTSYQWTLSPGGEICALGQPTDRRVVAKWTAAGTHWVSVNYTGAAGCPGNMATVYPITIIPAPTPTITGPNSVCEGGQINTYSTESGMNGYQWSVSSGGTIAGGFGSNQINVIWNTTGNHTVTVSYTNIFGCEAVTPTIYPVSVTPLPVPLLLGPVNACLGSTGNVYVTDPGNSAYDWTISAGGVIAAGGGPNDHSVTVQWNTVGAQSVSVNFTSPAGCEAIIPTNLAVFVQPASVPVVNGPATVCQGEPAVSYMTQAGMSGYTWTVSSGGQIISGSGTNAVMVQWFGSGSQTLSVNFTNPTGCTATAATVKDVTVSERPLANFTTDPICQGTVTTFTNTSTAGGGNFTSYWTFGDGGTSNAASPTHIYSAPGNYNVALTVTNLAGCSHDTNRVVAVYPKPNALFTNSVSNCAGDSVQFTDLSTTAHGHITDWVWDFGDGTPVASITFPGNPSIKHKFTNGGNYNVKLTVTTSDGCEAERISLVTIAVKPLANFAFGSGACANLPLAFTDLSQLNGGPPISAWLWNFGDPGSGTANSSTMQNPMHLFSSGGSYTVKLQINNANGCIDSISKTVVVNSAPVAAFSVDSSCINTATQFHDESTASSGNIVAWLWNFGDPSSGSANTSTLQHPVHVFSAQGIYWVNLQVTTAAQCVRDTSILVTTNPTPIADFQFSTSCEDDLTFFTDLSVAPNSSNKSWEWDFGDGGTANIQHPSYQYQNAGTYQVRLIVTNLFNCRDTVIKPVIVRYKPLANYTYENRYCPALLVSFQDSSLAYGGAFIQDRLWQFGQGATSNIANPQYTFAQGNMYHPVNLIVTDNFGCRDTIFDSVFVKPGYDLTFSYDTACFGATTHFNAINLAAGDTLYSIHWDFGDPASGPNNTSGLKSPVHQFSSTGSFMVRLRAYNSDNCVDSLFRMVSVRKLPQPSFTHSTTVCNDTVRFTDTSKPGFGEISQWQWIWGDASAPAVITPPWDGDTLHKYPGPGNFPLKLIVTNEHGCIDSIQEQIIVTCITAGFTQTNAFNCSSDSTGFRDLSSPAAKIGSWHWDFGDGQTLDYTTQRDTVRHKFTPGSWLVSLTVQNTATPPVASVYQTNVTIHPSPTAQFSVNPVCSGDSSRFLDLALSNQGTITSREWYFGDGTNQIFTDTVVNPVHFYLKAGKFNTKFVVRTDNNCRDSVVQIVKVNRLPVAMFSGSPPCERHAVEFHDASLEGDTTMAQWRWYFTGQPSGDTLRTESVSQKFDAAGETEIYFKVTDKNGCSDDTLYTGFMIRQTPVSAFTITDNIDGKQGKIRLNNLSQGMMDKGWKWDYETGQSTASSPVVTYSDDSRSYTIQLVTWNEANCYDTTKLTYQFIFDNLFVPNAFSPDSYILDIREFKPKGRNLQDYKLMVFNKWGHLVFETNKIDEDGRPVEGWDGKFNGEPLPQDVYVWKIQATFKNNKVWQGSDSGTGSSGTTGTVTLIR